MSEVEEHLEPQAHGGALKRLNALPLPVPARVLHGEIMRNPALLGWPPTLALEIAMRIAPIKAICESYHIPRDEWDMIRQNPSFVAELAASVEALRKEGAAFKARATLQSLELLKESWRMIHDSSFPPAVRADLLKFTISAAGLNEAKNGQAASPLGKGNGVGFNIQINLGKDT